MEGDLESQTKEFEFSLVAGRNPLKVIGEGHGGKMQVR